MSNGDSQGKAGEIIKNERLAKRISIDSIARDLKINPRYIEAIEEGRYDAIPSRPYVRVYIHSMCKYLNLPAEKILKAFCEEEGIAYRPDEVSDPIAHKTEPRQQEQQNQQPASGPAANKRLMLIIAAIIAAAAIATLLLFYSSEQTEVVTTETTEPALAEIAPAEDTPLAADTLAIGDVEVAESISDSIVLFISALDDSSWLRVFEDGVEWKNTLKPGQTRRFSAKDSINIRSGNNAALSYRLGDQDITPVNGGGVVAFKIDRNGITKWSLSKWDSVFKQ